jgi:hypothetical protein
LERIDAFHSWLSEQEFEKSFLLLDDLDIAPRAAIEAALPQQPRNILITTRNPLLVQDLEEAYHLMVHYIRLPNLAVGDVVEYTSRRFKSLLGDGTDHSYTMDHINTVSRLAVGHPLVASRIVSYIAATFPEEYGPRAVEEFVLRTQKASSFRRIPIEVFTHKPMFQCSIAETFESSRKRLPQPDEPSWTLMRLIAFMVQDDSAFIHFIFHKRPWILENEHSFAFHDVWSADPKIKWGLLSNLRKVSMGSSASQSGLLYFHPVLIQYIQEQTERGLRIRILQDIMLLAIESIESMKKDRSSNAETVEQKTAIEMLSAQALHCAKLCKAYGISSKHLGLAPRFDSFFKKVKL